MFLTIIIVPNHILENEEFETRILELEAKNEAQKERILELSSKVQRLEETLRVDH